ncbi:MAG: FG-GAP-like repeat-containing protein [Melioribacteraceae bacterium]|nr:FG-GAP-like repeat-containing protein [Melioribacteraceae bacterium]MCF8354255.1 FG-GAP-like repeat-containing protein [Melioribacteraceae bacterium]MCF8394819.1 FG-GAP-like repeat-containing protein [Melioribacteraceae bacterium]MCF8417986.1 FG-GAP-like repeat-containing protein [Melioribacteraceae bacterium]
MKFLKTYFSIFFITILSSAQTTNVISVTPEQNEVGVSSTSQIVAQLDTPIYLFSFQPNNIFQVYGTNSGLVLGTIEIDTVENTFIFSPQKSLFCGEIIDVFFGPLISCTDSSKLSFQWSFTIGITNTTNANFDSLARFNYQSKNAIANDYDDDGDIDLISSSGKVIFNDGAGGFTFSEQIPGISNVKYLVDVNNDKFKDVISYSTFGFDVFLGDSTGSFYLYQNVIFFGALIIAKGDINGDGFIDLIAKEQWSEYVDYSWIKLMNDGTGRFIKDTNSVYLDNYISEADLVDMDNDGDLDLVLLNTWPSEPGTQFEGAYIYLNNGLGDFTNSFRTRFYICPFDYWLEDLRQLFVADYNLDGLNDLASFGSLGGGQLILQNPDSTFCGYVETAFSGAENFAFFTSGDLNGDNRFDMIVSNLQVCPECGDTGNVRMSTYLNFNPTDFWADSSVNSFNLGLRNEVGNSVSPITADVDGDGDLDIIHTGNVTTVTYNENVITGISKTQPQPQPLSFYLYQNYPNPFNPSTTIDYAIPKSGHVVLSVVNILGKTVITLVNRFQEAGYYTVNFNSLNLASGVYFYRINTGKYTSVKKMLLIK